MKSITIQPSHGLHGTITVPGDKSISHRAVIFASLAQGTSTIRHLLLGEDVLSTLRIFGQMGIAMSHSPKNLQEGDILTISGKGLHGLKKPSGVLDCGNSGTTLRLLMGLLAAQPFESVLTGDDSLNKRPIDRVIKPLIEMGAGFDVYFEKGRRFIKVIGNPNLKAITYDLPVASAQLKSAILLAGLYADGKPTIKEPFPSRNHTEIMIQAVIASDQREGNNDLITPFNITIPGDFSSAAFFLVAGLIVPNSQITLKEVGVNPTRTALLDILKKMGGQISITHERQQSGEPIADLSVKSSTLKGVNLNGKIIPNLIDEIPIFIIAAAQAQGMSSVSDAQELRVKESDRIAVMAKALKKMGVKVDEKPDGMTIYPTSSFKEGTFKSHGDHRVAMSCAIAALVANASCVIEDIDCVSTSYPLFFQTLILSS